MVMVLREQCRREGFAAGRGEETIFRQNGRGDNNFSDNMGVVIALF